MKRRWVTESRVSYIGKNLYKVTKSVDWNKEGELIGYIFTASVADDRSHGGWRQVHLFISEG